MTSRAPQNVSLPEDDYCAILDVIANLQSPQTSRSLAELFRSRLLPLLGAGACFYAWGDPDDDLRPRIIGTVGIHRREVGTLQSFLPWCRLARHMVERRSRVGAYDLDLPRRELHTSIERFFQGHPAGDARGRSFLDRIKTVLLTIDDGEPGVVVALHRLDASRGPFTLREKRILELLGPHLGRAIRALPPRAEPHRQAPPRGEDPLPVRNPTVQVTGDSTIVDQSPNFGELFDSQPGDTLSAPLTRALALGIASFHRPFDTAPPEPEASWLCHCPNLFRVEVRRCDDDRWVLELHPSTGACPCFNPILGRFGLTPKELEVCCRVRQGYDNREIASQLCMSIHTAKTHLKNIHRKLDISNRARLVSFLSTR